MDIDKKWMKKCIFVLRQNHFQLKYRQRLKSENENKQFTKPKQNHIDRYTVRVSPKRQKTRRFTSTNHYILDIRLCNYSSISNQPKWWPILAKKRNFIADVMFFVELNEVLTRELAEDVYSSIHCIRFSQIFIEAKQSNNEK